MGEGILIKSQQKHPSDVNFRLNDLSQRKQDPYAMAKCKTFLNWMGDIAGKFVIFVESRSSKFAAMVAHTGADVIAVDISDEYVALACKTASNLRAVIKTFASHLGDFKFKWLFDIVAATDVIKHIEDEKEVLEDLSSLLKLNRQLLITVPARPSLFGYHDEVLGHYRGYTARTFRVWASRQFRLDRMRHYRFCLIFIAWLISKMLSKSCPMAQVGEKGGEGFKKTLFASVIGGYLGAEKIFHPLPGRSFILLSKPNLDY